MTSSKLAFLLWPLLLLPLLLLDAPVPEKRAARPAGTAFTPPPTLDPEADAGGRPELTRLFDLELSGRAFVFVVDRSEPSGDTTVRHRSRDELTRCLETLPDGVEIALVHFDRGIRRFPGSGKPARLCPEIRASAIAIASGLGVACGSATSEAFRAALETLGSCAETDRSLVFIGANAAEAVSSLPSSIAEPIAACAQSLRIYWVDSLRGRAGVVGPVP